MGLKMLSLNLKELSLNLKWLTILSKDKAWYPASMCNLLTTIMMPSPMLMEFKWPIRLTPPILFMTLNKEFLETLLFVKAPIILSNVLDPTSVDGALSTKNVFLELPWDPLNNVKIPMFSMLIPDGTPKISNQLTNRFTKLNKLGSLLITLTLLKILLPCEF